MKYGTGEDEPSTRGPIDQPAPMDSAGQQRPKAPGAGYRLDEGRKAEPVDCLFTNPSDTRAIHAKTLRTIAGRYQTGAWCIEYVCALQAFLILTNQEGIGAARDRFIDWTGARPNWKKRMREGDQEAREGGFIEAYPRTNGETLNITEKGQRMIEDYDRRYSEILKDMRDKRVLSVIKRMNPKKRGRPRRQAA